MKLYYPIILILLLLISCTPEPTKITINAKIKGGEGKYIKFIDMTRLGLKPDSILLDMGGNFTFEKETKQAQDYILFFKNNNHIRITPLPNEILTIEANASNLNKTSKISGSDESERVLNIVKRIFNSSAIIDTLDAYYMKNQLNPRLDSIVNKLIYLSDSIYETDKDYLQKIIKKTPGSLASYVALSQKLDNSRAYFNIENDLEYFEMVDTALFNAYDTIPMSRMLNMYILKAKAERVRKKPNAKIKLGSQAPEIFLPNFYGDSLKLSDLRGKYVLIDFWGSWCKPCRKENKNLRKAYKTFRYKGFEIFQVAIEHNKQDWKKAIGEDRLYWKFQVSDLDYMESNTAKNFKVNELPTNFLINPEGKIIGKNLYGEELTKMLNKCFAPKQPKAEINGK